MNKFLSTVNSSIRSFAKDEEGAQVVEYALIIAVISIALILSMQTLTATDFQAWIDRVGALLNPAAPAP